MSTNVNDTTTARLPSEVVAPQRTDSIPQQGSTQPGDGSELHGEPKLSFAERTIAAAQITRGTLLGQESVKKHGEKILEGTASAQDDKKNL
ncbi:hypothetical protein BDV98DRAFT_588247 [Pterulicium gracile]|uniref:Uncharacterized protein n=1 Tax=Pterulicium gracile TaxID=1884261 RepID=A0A5C3R8J6_9AGAR|nr:hypothetical protein BDV98DRAFT_588247 [Pterula gracilis]